MIYFAASGAVNRLNLSTAAQEYGVVRYPAIENVNLLINAVIVDDAAGQLYWAQQNGVIKRSNLDGSAAATLYSGGNAPHSLALYRAGVADYLYWLDGFDLYRLDLADNSAQVILTFNNRPTALLASSLRGYLLLAGLDARYANRDAILQVAPDGSRVTPLIVGQAANYLALDEYAGKLYWHNPADKALRRANAGDGSDIQTLPATWNGNLRGLFIDPAAQTLYYLVNGGGVFDNDLFALTLANGSVQRLFDDALPSNAGIAPAYVAPTPTPTITPVPTLNPTATPLPTPLPTPQPPVAGAADAIYVLGNPGVSTIWRAPIAGCADGLCLTAVVSDSEPIEQFAVDTRNALLYYTVTDTVNQLKRAPLAGGAAELLVDDPNFALASFALDVEGNYLYYPTNRGATDAIVRLELTTLVTDTLVAGLPTGVRAAMAVDRLNGYLYWHSLANGAIERARLADGGNITTVISGSALGGLGNPLVRRLAIDTARNWLFWQTDDSELRRADLNCANPAQCVVATYQRETGVYRDFALDPARAVIYWSQFIAGEGDSVAAAPVNGSGPAVLVLDNLVDAVRLALAFPPAACTPDVFEPADNDGLTGTVLRPGGRSRGHAFDSPADVDWFRMRLTGGLTYRFAVTVIGQALTPELTLFSNPPNTQLASNHVGLRPYIDYTPPVDAIVRLRVRNATLTTACNTDYTLAFDYSDNSAGAPLNQVPGYAPPKLASSAFVSPTQTTRAGALTLTGGAYALDYLRALTVSIDSAIVYTQSWPAATLTETTWSTSWTPPGSGQYTLASTVSDWAGGVQTETVALPFVVDDAPPTVTISTTVITTAGRVGDDAVLLRGAVGDDAGIVQVAVSVDGAPLGLAQVAADGWRLPLPLSDLDAQTRSVTAVATDLAGNTTAATTLITIDALPPRLDGIALRANGTPIAVGQTIRSASPDMAIEWPAATERGAIAGYYVGWTAAPTATIGALSAYGAAGSHTQVVADPQIVYAHIIVVDGAGNANHQTFGPFYVDGPLTPDLVSDLAYSGWQTATATQFGNDGEIGRVLFAQTIAPEQRFYASWNADVLRLSWRGGDWDVDGDLWIYLDTAAGGATRLHDPHNAANISLPSGMTADVAVWVQSATHAQLLTYSGGWQLVRDLTAAEFATAAGARTADVALDWALLGNPLALKLVALATEDDALALWAASPDRNPLNSRRVVNPLAVGRDLSSFALTGYHTIVDPATPQIPNAGQFTAGVLALDVRPSVSTLQVGWLASDLLDVLAPAAPLDGDLDGALDQPLPLAAASTPLGAGHMLSFTLSVTNHGRQTVPAVTIDATASGALALNGTAQIDLGDIAAGATVQHVVTAQIAPAVGRLRPPAAAGELRLALADGARGTYDWVWLHYRIDHAPPATPTIATPQRFVGDGMQWFGGSVLDASGVPTVTLEVEALPARARQTIVCPDDSPADGLWTCGWDAGTLAGIDTLSVRARATDEHGNVGAWSAWQVLVVDTTPPQATFGPAVDAALADGWLSATERQIGGSVVDDYAASGLIFCDTPAGLLASCQQLMLTPGDQSQGTWAQRVAIAGVDGVTHTLSIVGVDAVGNLSLPVSRTLRIDSVPPRLTRALPAPSPRATQMLSGTVADGGAVLTVTVRVRQAGLPDRWVAADLNGMQWAATVQITNTQTATLTVEAWDAAGNAAAIGPYVIAADQTAVGLRGLALSAPPLAHLSAGVLLLWVTGWLLWRRRRMRQVAQA